MLALNREREFKRYAKLKNPEIEWLNEIPEHWQIMKLRWKVKEHKQGYYIAGDYIDDGVKLARISDISQRGQIDYSEMPYVKINETDERQYKLTTNDFIFARTGSVGHFGHVESDNNRAVFASYLIRFRFRDLVSKYLKFFFQSTYFKESLMIQLHGGVNQNIHAENIKDVYQICPPIPEQKIIADFLESETSKLDQLIAKKQGLIELLQEKRQALITQAVTKGLDPTVPMKDSGVEWLGEIPGHWKIMRIKFLVSQITKKSEIEENEDIRYLGLEHIESNTGKIIGSILASETSGSTYTFQPNDVLFGKLRPYLAKATIPEFSGLCTTELIVMRTKATILNQFLLYLILSPVFIQYINASTYGAKMPRTSWDFVGNTKIPVPDIDTQTSIVNFIEGEKSKLDEVISKLLQQINLIDEYRQTLITNAVTGKIDVRGEGN